MKKIVSVLLLIGLFVTAQSVINAQEKETVSDNDAIIAQIAKYREEGEQKLRDKKFTRKEIAFTGDNVKKRSSRSGRKWLRITKDQISFNSALPSPGRQRKIGRVLPDG